MRSMIHGNPEYKVYAPGHSRGCRGCVFKRSRPREEMKKESVAHGRTTLPASSAQALPWIAGLLILFWEYTPGKRGKEGGTGNGEGGKRYMYGRVRHGAEQNQRSRNGK